MTKSTMVQDANTIVRAGIDAVLPEAAVCRALEAHPLCGDVTVVAIGKAAWRMASAACRQLGSQVKQGLVITKYGHSMGPLGALEIIQAGHPVPDENSVRGGQRALELVSPLGAKDQILLLLSGGGSALFEYPLPGITLGDIADVTRSLLASGADITQINTIRKRLSAVKGGRFAQCCAPANVLSIILSDVLGDDLGSIASGPACADMSTAEDAKAIMDKYGITAPEKIQAALHSETASDLPHVKNVITGSVRELCTATAHACNQLGYRPYVMTSTMACEAREAGSLLASMVQEVRSGNSCFKAPCALILGGETVVHLRGKGLGGRNQEIATSAGKGIDGLADVCVVSYGSDGTDGPTDAAGGIVDGQWAGRCRSSNLAIDRFMADSDTYHLLQQTDALLITGPTGTNVNDVTFALVR